MSGRRASASSIAALYDAVRSFGIPLRPFLVSAATAVLMSLCEAGTLVLITYSAVEVAAPEATATSVGGLELTARSALPIAGGLLVARVVLAWVNTQVAASLAERCLLETRRRLLHAFAGARWEVQTRFDRGLLFDLFGGRAEVVAYSAGIVTAAVVTVMNLAVLVGVAVVLQPLAVLAMLATGALVGVVLRPLGRRTRDLSRLHLQANEVYLRQIGDLWRNARDLSLYGVGQPFVERVMVQQGEAATLYRRRTVLAQFTPYAYQSIALGLAVGGLSLATALEQADVAALGAVVLLLLRGMAYGQALISATQSANDRVPWLAGLAESLGEMERGRAISGGGQFDPSGDLELRSVSFHYGDAPVLVDLDLRISAGQRVGIVGPSGSGKSTLLQLLAGLRVASHGSYLVGGVPVEEVSSSSWSSAVAMVSQESHLLSGSVSENVVFLRDLDEGVVAPTLERAQLWREVEALGGPSTVLGDDVRSLSGGQMQRLAIARAFAGAPSLLLLDEPTSALDVRTERRLQKVLDGLHGEATLVIVAHRLATVSTCDRVLVLESGRIVADGPPDEVLARYDESHIAAWEMVDSDAGDQR